MLATLWHDALYQPLLNALFFLYDRAAGENLAIAVIELTVIMRLALLPFSVLAEHKRGKLETLSRAIEEIKRQFKNDPIKQRVEARKLLRQHKINPWAKIVVLGVQVLVLLVLYQVFLGGIDPAKLVDLYDGVRRPDIINTMFLGFDVALRNTWWAVGVGAMLFLEIAITQAPRRHALERRDVFYRYFFPIAAAVLLAYLPMVKSLFILTTMAFSAVIFGLRQGMTADA
ncbi:MAG: YidC/Oxa1 family membrane protein insertase [bacterium]|nr:YidC/Oxa1 family membrane protein insertase [bacterium]